MAKRQPPQYWRIYTWIRQICHNPNHPRYHKYGGAGIGSDWPEPRSYDEFYEWLVTTLGHQPEGHVLGRKDKRKGFTKRNLEWQTPKHRTRTGLNSSIKIRHEGQIRALMEWCEIYDLKPQLVRRKTHEGKSLAQILKEAEEWKRRHANKNV